MLHNLLIDLLCFIAGSILSGLGVYIWMRIKHQVKIAKMCLDCEYNY